MSPKFGRIFGSVLNRAPDQFTPNCILSFQRHSVPIPSYLCSSVLLCVEQQDVRSAWHERLYMTSVAGGGVLPCSPPISRKRSNFDSSFTSLSLSLSSRKYLNVGVSVSVQKDLSSNSKLDMELWMIDE